MRITNPRRTAQPWRDLLADYREHFDSWDDAAAPLHMTGSRLCRSCGTV